MICYSSQRFAGRCESKSISGLNSQDGEDLSSVQLCIVELSDEDSGDALEYGRAVHVNSSPDGKDEAADTFVHTVVLLNTFYHRGKSC